MNSNKKFHNKVVLITGASSGIGKEAALAFAKEGADLLLASRRLELLNEVAESCRKLGARCEVVSTDIQNMNSIQNLVSQLKMHYKKCDVLVNNAGLGFYGFFHEQSWKNIHTTIQTNLVGTMALTHELAPMMISAKSGVIVNVSSVIGKRAIPQFAAYCASKFALWGFSDALRDELKLYDIHVCHFCPALTETEFQELAGMKSGALHAQSAETVAKALVQAVIEKKDEHIMWPEKVRNIILSPIKK